MALATPKQMQSAKGIRSGFPSFTCRITYTTLTSSMGKMKQMPPMVGVPSLPLCSLT